MEWVIQYYLIQKLLYILYIRPWSKDAKMRFSSYLQGI